MGLIKTTDMVKSILEKDNNTRNSDELLYTEVLKIYGRDKGIDFNKVSVSSFFMAYKKYGIPSIETVGRCRRKVQEEYPELRGDNPTTAARRTKEKEFRNYARY